MKITTKIHKETHGSQEETVLSLRILAEMSEQRAQEAIHKENFKSARKKYHLAVLFLDRAMKLAETTDAIKTIAEAKDKVMKQEYDTLVAVILKRK